MGSRAVTQIHYYETRFFFFSLLRLLRFTSRKLKDTFWFYLVIFGKDIMIKRERID